jgi:hypothetical protein
VSDPLNLKARFLLLPPQTCLQVLVLDPLHFLLRLEGSGIEILETRLSRISHQGLEVDMLTVYAQEGQETLDTAP